MDHPDGSPGEECQKNPLKINGFFKLAERTAAGSDENRTDKIAVRSQVEIADSQRLMTIHRSLGILWGKSWGEAPTLGRNIHENQSLRADPELQVQNIE